MHFQRHFGWWMRWWCNFIHKCKGSKVSNVNLFWKSKVSFVFFSSVNTLCVLGFHWLHFWHFQIVPSTTSPAFTRITGPGSYRKTEFQSSWGVLCSCLDPLFVWGTFLPHLLHIQFTYSGKKLSGNIRDNFILWRPSFMHCMKQGSCRKSTK